MALDLGTSRTAFSWKSLLDPTPYFGVPEDTEGVPDAKSPTAVLLSGDVDPTTKVFQAKDVMAFGNMAEEQFANGARAQLFKRFKMVSDLFVLFFGALMLGEVYCMRAFEVAHR